MDLLSQHGDHGDHHGGHHDDHDHELLLKITSMMWTSSEAVASTFKARTFVE